MTTEPKRLTPKEIDDAGFVSAAMSMRQAVHKDPTLQSNNFAVLQSTSVHVIANLAANFVCQTSSDVDKVLDPLLSLIVLQTKAYIEAVKKGKMEVVSAVTAAPKIVIAKGDSK